MDPYTVYDSEGRIERSGYCPPDDVPLQYVTGQTFVVRAVSDPNTDYVLDRQVMPRPILPPLPAEPAAPFTVPVPEGARVRATNAAGESVETSDPADPVILTESGTYRIEMFPRFPHMPVDVEYAIA